MDKDSKKRITPVKKKKSRGWDPVAKWYNQLVGKGGSDYHQQVIVPAALKLLGDLQGKKVLDLCCGQGFVIADLLQAGAAEVLGVDASESLIRFAEKNYENEEKVKLLVDDACGKNCAWADGSFDTLISVMAVHDVENLPQMAQNAADSLRIGGEMVAIFMHPCFRVPRQTHWGWDEGRKLQYRRIDRYGVELAIPIHVHPGKGAAGKDAHTMFYHRPLATVLNAFGKAGLSIVETEELYSHRRSQAGGSRSKGEHRAAREIPIFLALRMVKNS